MCTTHLGFAIETYPTLFDNQFILGRQEQFQHWNSITDQISSTFVGFKDVFWFMFVYKGSSFHFYTLSVSELAHYFFALSVLKCHSNLSTKRKYQCHKLLKHGKKGNSLLLPLKTFSLLECKRKNVYASKVFCERSLFYFFYLTKVVLFYSNCANFIRQRFRDIPF